MRSLYIHPHHHVRGLIYIGMAWGGLSIVLRHLPMPREEYTANITLRLLYTTIKRQRGVTEALSAIMVRKRNFFQCHLNRFGRILSKTKSLLTLLALMASSGLYAATSPSGKEYTITKDGLYYSGTTSLMLVDADWIDNLVIPAEVDGIPVTSVADEAFKDRVDIESLVTPATLTDIGASAFRGCESLASIDLSASTNLTLWATAFHGASLANQVILPQRLFLDSGVFNYTGIKNVDCEFVFKSSTLPSGIFNGCSELVSARVRLEWLYSANNRGIFPVPRRMFFQCTKLENVVIEGEVTGFGTEAFAHCSSLKSVTYTSNSVTSLGEYAFYNTTSLEHFELKEGLKTVGNRAFSNSAIKELNIPSTLTSDPATVFYEARNLERITYPSLEMFLAKPPFLLTMNTSPAVYIDGDMITEITIPTTTTIIPGTAFKHLGGIRKVTIPNMTTAMTIGDNAFACCSDLEEVEIGAGKTTIDRFAFAYCKNLRSFKLNSKNKCTSLGESAFQGCENLTTFDAEGITDLGKLCLEGTTMLTTFNCPNLTTIGLGALRVSGILAADFPLLETAGYEAFRDCARLETVNLPKLVEYNNLVWGCSSLRSISCPAVTKFDGTFISCTSLTDVNFDALETFKNGSPFEECTSLEHLSLPSLTNLEWSEMPKNIVSVDFPALQTMTGRIFQNCTKLRSVNMPLLRVIPGGAFDGCESLPTFDFTNITEIGPEAFRNCKSLTEISAPVLQNIMVGAFNGCTALTKFEVGQAGYPITDLGSFTDCTSLSQFICHAPVEANCYGNSFINIADNAEIVFKNEVKDQNNDFISNSNVRKVVFEGNVGFLKGAFIYATNLEEITFKGTVGGFGAGCFSGCSNIKKVKIGNLSSWLTATCGDDGNPGCVSTSDVNYYHVWGNREDLIKDLVVPANTGVRQDAFIRSTIESVSFAGGDVPVSIDKGAFYHCHLLTSVSIGDSVKAIGQDAFSYCSSLNSLDLGNGIESISRKAFAYCTALETVQMPESVTELGIDCFAYNPLLKSITISPNVEAIPVGLVYNCEKIERLIMPEGVKTIDAEVINGYSTAINFISLPSTLTSLSTSPYRLPSFKDLDRDAVIYSWAMQPPYASNEDFNGLEVHIPIGSLEAYRNNNVWSRANLIDDLNADHPVEAVGTTIVVTIPQNSIHSDAQVSNYKVTVTELDADGNDVASTDYFFDVNGNPVTKSGLRRAADTTGTQLRIEGLNGNTPYRLEVRGYTNDNSLVYDHQSNVSTGEGTTGIEAVDADSLTDAEFYNLRGEYLGNNAEGLPSGIYIVRTGKGTFKLRK